jgi:IS1 family transposase
LHSNQYWQPFGFPRNDDFYHITHCKIYKILLDKENKLWLWRAIDGQTRRPLAWLLGNRDADTVKKLIDMVDDGKCNFITDEYAPFFKHIPEDRHYYGKDITFPIEQSNSDIRHWLARFI